MTLTTATGSASGSAKEASGVDGRHPTTGKRRFFGLPAARITMPRIDVTAQLALMSTAGDGSEPGPGTIGADGEIDGR